MENVKTNIKSLQTDVATNAIARFQNIINKCLNLYIYLFIENGDT